MFSRGFGHTMTEPVGLGLGPVAMASLHSFGPKALGKAASHLPSGMKRHGQLGSPLEIVGSIGESPIYIYK